MFDHFELLKKILAILLGAIAVVFTIALVIGGLFFNLDAAMIASWFCYVVIAVFALLFIYAVLAFIGWFLTTRPYVIIFLLGALAVVFVGVFVFVKLVGGPIFDIQSLLEPIMSFLK